MAVLQTLSRPLMVELRPRTLYDFSRFLLEAVECREVQPDDDLAGIPEDLETFSSEQGELEKKFKEYRDKVVDVILRFTKEAATEKEIEMAILIDDMRRCTADDLRDKLETRSGVPHIGGIDAFEYAVQVLLHTGNTAIFGNIAKTAKRQIPVGYHYYEPEASLFTPNPDAKVGDELNADLKGRIEEKMAEVYSTKVCVVRSEEQNGKWYIEVYHGGMRQKTESEKDAQSKDMVFQPLESDSIVYNTRTHDIKVRMAKHKVKVERDTYIPALAGYLSGDTIKWKQDVKFDLAMFNVPKDDLNALLARAGEEMSSPELGNVTVRVAEVAYEVPVQRPDVAATMNKLTIMNNDVGLNNSMAPGTILVPDATPTRIVFSAQFQGAKKKNSLRISLTSKSLGECHLSQSFETWLEREGISIIPQQARAALAEEASPEPENLDTAQSA